MMHGSYITRGAVESCTHGSTVAMNGRSEYICDRFPSSSVTTEGEFNTTTSVFTSWIYMISPKNDQNHSFQLCTALTIFCSPFCICQPGFLGVNGEDTSQQWERSRTRRERISLPLNALADNPSNCIHDHNHEQS